MNTGKALKTHPCRCASWETTGFGGGGEFLALDYSPGFPDAPWEVASLSTSGSRGKWRPEGYPVGLTGKIMGLDLALSTLFPASNTWIDLAVVCV